MRCGYGVPDPRRRRPLLVDLSVRSTPASSCSRRTLRAARCSARVLIGVCRRPGAARRTCRWREALTLSLRSRADGAAPLPPFVAVADPVRPQGRGSPMSSAQRPLCIGALAVLLQQTALLPVWEGLVAESATYSTLLAGTGVRRLARVSAAAATPAPDGDEPVLVERHGDRAHADAEPARAA